MVVLRLLYFTVNNWHITEDQRPCVGLKSVHADRLMALSKVQDEELRGA